MRPDATATLSFGSKVRQCLSDVVYGFFSCILWATFRIFFKVRLIGMEHCPARGPLLVASNHISEWDPPFLGSQLPWQVNWVAKVELFELFGGAMNPFFRTLHCIPVDRNKADLSAIKQALRRLKSSRPVVVFAEGGIRRDEGSVLGAKPELKEGAAIMAIMSGAPVLPVLINGTFGIYSWKTWLLGRRHTLEVVVGPVFRPSGRDRVEATREILERLSALKPQLTRQTIA